MTKCRNSTMKCKKVGGAKIIFGCFNTIFFMCGFVEVVCGFLMLSDSQRILLSRLLAPPDTELPHPPFYYIALAMLAAGLITCLASALGSWATYLPGYITLTIYFMVVLALLVCECAGGGAAAVWPRCVGLRGEPADAVVALQEQYAVPDHEHYTAAVDLAQFQLECCGMSDARDYESSAWRTRRLGPRGLAVPLTCCAQLRAPAPAPAPATYLNPAPLNATRCQEDTPDPLYRHLPGCQNKLEEWYQTQYIVFMLALFVAALLKLTILLSTVFACVRLRKQRRTKLAYAMKHFENHTNENIYDTQVSRVRDEPITAKYIQPNNFYSPQVRNPRLFQSKPNEMI